MRLVSHCTMSLAGILVLLVTPGVPADQNDPNIASTPPRTPEEERQAFHLPAGFEVQLVAAEPYVRKPINMNFDDRGRLWVTESIEYPFPAAAGKPHRDTVRIFEDTNGDGLADEVTTFTDGLNIPIGVLPLSKGALVYSIPNIYRLHDRNGDDRADGRDLLMGTYGHRDTHGMTGEFTLGFDGWVYACHGFSNTSTIKASDGSSITMNSGNTYRFRLDGAHVEQFTHGQVNPFGLTLDPLGNLYSCDCHSRPIYQLLRGAFYPSFGKPDDGLGFGPEMMTHDHGSTAIAGITYYAADHFPPEYRDTVFVGNVVTNRINHDRLERHGSSYRAIEQPDFLKSDDPWFRPVDIKLGPDGALYVADFYNRIIGHYEVPLTHPGRDHTRGRIWRIVYRGPDGKGPNPVKPRADWGKASVAELVQDLGHPNLTVRMKAMNQLAERADPEIVGAVRPLFNGGSKPFQRMHGLWVLERRGALDDKTLERAVKDSDRGVRVHAMRVLAERRQLAPAEHRWVVACLKDPDAFVQRQAADALGTHPADENVRPLLDLRYQVPADDTHLLHVVRMALREQLRPAAAWAHVPVATWKERDSRAVADVATGVPSAESAAFLFHHLRRFAEPADNRVRYVHHIARYARDDVLPFLLEYVQADGTVAPLQQVALFKAVQQGTQERGAQLPPAVRQWGEDLVRKLLASPGDAELGAGIELAGVLKMDKARDLLAALAADRAAPEPRRATALAALVAVDARKQVGLLAKILGDGSEPFGLREKAAGALGAMNQPEAQDELLKGLASVPERLARVVAVDLAAGRPGGEKLLDAVAAGKASPRLLQERAVVLRLQNSRIPALQKRLDTLTHGLPPADQHVQEILNRRREGFAAAHPDPSAGAKVFEKNCAVCHQIANHGAKIGPQLDGVGIRGIDRILEDILDPNRNVDQAFRSTTLTLSNGQIVTGLLLREEGQVLIVADSQGKEVRVPKSSVEEKVVSALSPMPANLADQIPEQEFYHLIAYLLAQKPKDKPAGNK